MTGIVGLQQKTQTSDHRFSHA